MLWRQHFEFVTATVLFKIEKLEMRRAVLPRRYDSRLPFPPCLAGGCKGYAKKRLSGLDRQITTR